MATPGKKLDLRTRQNVLASLARGWSIRQAAIYFGLSWPTVKRISKEPR